ncbi:hypothetical protein IID22_03120 [Patescibacteria group bacterium]|nr:hypothetical protein [Patescibacteria group bacterium]
MKTIILPGYSPKNKEWADEIAKQLDLALPAGRQGHEVFVHNWKHWKDGGSMSIRYEMEKIKEELGEGDFNILAKSVGSRIAIRVLSEVKGRVNKVILTGIASISEDTKKAYEKALADFPPEKIICFQNTKDPFVPYSEVKKFIQGVNPKIKVIEKPGNEHHYPYYSDFQKFLE